jgi:hypothetical protein
LEYIPGRRLFVLKKWFSIVFITAVLVSIPMLTREVKAESLNIFFYDQTADSRPFTYHDKNIHFTVNSCIDRKSHTQNAYLLRETDDGWVKVAHAEILCYPTLDQDKQKIVFNREYHGELTKRAYYKIQLQEPKPKVKTRIVAQLNSIL